MTSKHICPQCGNNTFITTAHVVQDWKVDEDGNFIECVKTTETTHPPNDANIWTCTECGAEAVIENDQEKPIDEYNTVIEYMCRDSSNYKSYDKTVVKGVIGQSQKDTILNSLMDGEYFVPEAIGLSAERKWSYDPETNDMFWELHAADIRITDKKPTTDLTLEQIANAFASYKGKWQNFDYTSYM